MAKGKMQPNKTVANVRSLNEHNFVLFSRIFSLNYVYIFMFSCCGYNMNINSKQMQSCLKNIGYVNNLPRTLEQANCSMLVLLAEQKEGMRGKMRKIEQTNGAYRLFSKQNWIGKCTIWPDNEYGNGPLATYNFFVDLLQIYSTIKKYSIYSLCLTYLKPYTHI